MKKIFVLIMCLCVMTGCYNTQTTTNNKLKVYTSFYPMQSLAQEIGKNYVEVVNMTPAGEEAHDFEPSVQDIAGLEKADVFVYNGAGMEHWVEDITDAISSKDLIMVNASEKVDTIQLEGKEAVDPHTWLSLRNAMVQAETVATAFIKADPQHEDAYTKNKEAYIQKLKDLDEKYTKLLDTYKGKMIAVAHASFGYLCRDYGFSQLAVDGLSSESEPSPAKMKEMIETIKDKDISVVFYEGVSNPKVAETIAQETNIKTGTLSTLESLSEDEQKANASYLSVMEKNLEALYDAFRQ